MGISGAKLWNQRGSPWYGGWSTQFGHTQFRQSTKLCAGQRVKYHLRNNMPWSSDLLGSAPRKILSLKASFVGYTSHISPRENAYQYPRTLRINSSFFDFLIHCSVHIGKQRVTRELSYRSVPLFAGKFSPSSSSSPASFNSENQNHDVDVLSHFEGTTSVPLQIRSLWSLKLFVCLTTRVHPQRTDGRSLVVFGSLW